MPFGPRCTCPTQVVLFILDTVSFCVTPLQGMDIYSNILYVKEEFGALSALAHRCVQADKYRPETCCIVGNYYSLRWGAAGLGGLVVWLGLKKVHGRVANPFIASFSKNRGLTSEQDW
jgi:hypothetical protein